jgi:hypothetical protein
MAAALQLAHELTHVVEDFFVLKQAADRALLAWKRQLQGAQEANVFFNGRKHDSTIA